MPVQYEGVRAEHLAVRSACGVFDVSHMGEIETAGPGALELLQRLLSNDVAKLEVGGAQYSVLCREDGGVLDDLFTYRLADDRYLTVTNAANHERDLAWFAEHAGRLRRRGDATRSTDYAMLAVQGPEARAIVGRPRRRRAAAAHAHRDARRRRRGDARLRDRLHGRGRGRDPDRARARRRRSGTALLAARRDAGRPRRPRHAAARGLLSPLRQRPGRATATRSRPGLGWCCKEETGFIGSEAVAAGARRRHRRRSWRRSRSPGRGIPRQGNAVLAGGEPVGDGDQRHALALARASGSGWPTCAPTSPSPGPRSRSTCAASVRPARIESKPLYDPDRTEA